MKIIFAKVAAAISCVIPAALLFTCACTYAATTSTSNNSRQQVASTSIITGAGSTFIYPVLAQWTKTYAKETKVRINYQPIGSSGGINQLKNKTVIFAASDVPLDASVLTDRHWIQFPMIIGGIVPVVNLEKIKANQITLSGEVLAKIFMGEITKWNDPAIKKLNKSVTLPDSRIILVRRADGSGTTYNFTYYLNAVYPAWEKAVGVGTKVAWPTAAVGVDGKGNAGVANLVSNTPNSIGYVEYAYAIQNDMKTIKLVNKAGKVIVPSASAFASAAQYAHWSEANHFNLILANQPGKASWPIVATTFILLKKADKTNKGRDDNKGNQRALVLHFFDWAYKSGGDAAKKLDYVPIPSSVYNKVMAYWKANNHQR